MSHKPAATIGSNHTCPMVTGTVPHVGGPVVQGSPNVLIKGKPTARQGDTCVCTGPPDSIAQGNPSVLVNGLPIATIGSPTVHGGAIVMGESSVLVGTNTTAPPPPEPKKHGYWLDIDFSM